MKIASRAEELKLSDKSIESIDVMETNLSQLQSAVDIQMSDEQITGATKQAEDIVIQIIDLVSTADNRLSLTQQANELVKNKIESDPVAKANEIKTMAQSLVNRTNQEQSSSIHELAEKALRTAQEAIDTITSAVEKATTSLQNAEQVLVKLNSQKEQVYKIQKQLVILAKSNSAQNKGVFGKIRDYFGASIHIDAPPTELLKNVYELDVHIDDLDNMDAHMWNIMRLAQAMLLGASLWYTTRKKGDSICTLQVKDATRIETAIALSMARYALGASLARDASPHHNFLQLYASCDPSTASSEQSLVGLRKLREALVQWSREPQELPSRALSFATIAAASVLCSE